MHVAETGSRGLPHLNEEGRAHMVDVSQKPDTVREATARAILCMQPATLQRVKDGAVAKGDVLAVAQVAAIQGAKRTADLIPLCHPLPIAGIAVAFSFADESHLQVDVTVRTKGPTGVEMEALCGATAGALTVYDMCKAIDRAMTMSFVGLMEKNGGKSGHFVRQAEVAGEGSR